MEVKVSIPHVEGVKVSTKSDEVGLVSVIQIEARISPSDIARILNLEGKMPAPIYCVIGSTQAAMDLVVQQVDCNGEIIKVNAGDTYGQENE